MTTSQRLREMVGHLLARARPVARWAWLRVDVLRALLGVRQSESRLIADAAKYWDGVTPTERADMAHIREGGLGSDLFDALGKATAGRVATMYRGLGDTPEGLTVLEWGCGGGANLRALAPLSATMIGVDVSQAALDSAVTELEGLADASFVPHKVRADAPESAVDAFAGRVDLLVCVYVFELLPSPEYGERLLRIFRELLRPGGAALLQIKYMTTDRATGPRRFAYRVRPANMTTYAIDDFWNACLAAGLVPRSVELEPVQPLVHDERYAYFTVTKPA